MFFLIYVTFLLIIAPKYDRKAQCPKYPIFYIIIVVSITLPNNSILGSGPHHPGSFAYFFLPPLIGFINFRWCDVTATSFRASLNFSGNCPGSHSLPLSSTHTLCLALALRLAAIAPPYPDPITITSYSDLRSLIGEESR